MTKVFPKKISIMYEDPIKIMFGEDAKAFPEFRVVGDVDTKEDEMAGMLLMAYATACEAFVEKHSKNCHGCMAYRRHKVMFDFLKTELIERENKL